MPVALATGTATFVARFFLGLRPAFEMPPLSAVAEHPAPLYVLLLYAALGAATGLAAAGFIRTLHGMEGGFQRIANPYLRHAIGMFPVGILLYVLLRLAGQYHVDGVGYATIQDVLLGGLAAAPLLAILFGCKLLATTLSLGSGSSGGIFSPSLFMGATLGGAFGACAHMVHPSTDISIAAFAIVGMAAMVGGGTGAAMTAVTMIFEMTRDYDIVMPSIIAVAVSIGVRRLLSQENIYTIKLVARRHFIPKALHANMFLVRQAGDVMDKDLLVLRDDMGFDAFLRLPDHGGRMRHVVITHASEILGVLRVNTALRHGLEGAYTSLTLGEVAIRHFTMAGVDEVMFDVIGRMARARTTMIIVFHGTGRGAGDIAGLITKEHIADSVSESISTYASGESST